MAQTWQDINEIQKKNTTMIHLRLHYKNDADILEFLSKQESMSGTIKALIRKEIDMQEIKERRLL